MSFTRRSGSEGYEGSVSSRAQIVLWYDEGYRKGEIAAMSGASRVTVDKWLARYEKFGMDGLVSRTSPGGPRQIGATAVSVGRVS